MRFLLPLLTTLALGSTAQAACSASQDQQAARAVALQAAQSRLGTVAFMYRLMYSDVNYSVKVSQANISGGNATVRGHITLSGKERQSGKVASGTYPGTVFLKRAQACAWKVTGYKQG